MLQSIGEGSGVKHNLSQLFLDAQAAALEPSKWEHIVSELRNLVVPAGGAVILHATEPGRLVGLFQAGLDPAAVAAYISNYATDNPWLHAQRLIRPGIVYDLDELASLEELERSGFLGEWLEPNGSISAGAGIVLSRAAQCMIAIDVLTPRNDARTQSHARKMLRRVGPALTLAAEATHRLTASLASARRLEAALHVVSLPILVVDRQLRCNYRNPAGDQFLKRCDSIVVGDDMMLRCATGAVVSAVKTAMALSDDGQEAQPIRVHSPAGRITAHLTVHPLSQSRGVGVERFFSGEEDTFMIMVRGHRAGAAPPPAHLRRAFSLTSAETALARALLRGESLASYAQMQGLSRNTVRNHLSSIMRKTKTQRQADIVRVLSQFA